MPAIVDNPVEIQFGEVDVNDMQSARDAVKKEYRVSSKAKKL